MRDAAPRPARSPRRSAPVEAKGRLGPGRGLRVCVSSVPARDAARLARLLVTRRVAACVSMVPGVTSTYRWQGKVERAREVLLVVKTTGAALARCVALLAEAHPYEVPEVLVGAPARAGAAYAAWVHAETA